MLWSMVAVPKFRIGAEDVEVPLIPATVLSVMVSVPRLSIDVGATKVPSETSESLTWRTRACHDSPRSDQGAHMAMVRPEA